MGRREFLEVEELRNDQRLLVACDGLVLALARDLGANAQIVASDFKRDVLRIDSRQRNVDAPAIVDRSHLQRRRG